MKSQLQTPRQQVPDLQPLLAESYPDIIAARLKKRDSLLGTALASHDGVFSPEFVLAKFRRWPAGTPVRVAFLGGSDALRRDIESATRAWTNEANIVLDFGGTPGGTGYREWSPTDTDYSAEIRVAFFSDGQFKGQWSQIGTDSVNDLLSKPNEPSLNLHGFDVDRPTYWNFIIIHEFGRALGLVHEHQHPTEGCERDIRWEDDPGYVPTTDNQGRFIPDAQGRKPGVYTILGGPPNHWDRDRVDTNLRNVRASNAYQFSHFDKYSVIKYPMSDTWLNSGATSECFQLGINLELSPQDKLGIRAAYPYDKHTIEALAAEKKHVLAHIGKHASVDPGAAGRRAYLR
jgi:hypothetical protein